MRILIISHTEHYLNNDQVYGWGPTIREIDYLATLFEEVIHLAFLYPGLPPVSTLPYQSKNIKFLPLPPSGGENFYEKLKVIFHLPVYLWKIMWALRDVDVVHVRCPSNVSMLAIVFLSFLKYPKLRWVKYAGNWQPEGMGEPWSYRFQRWWLAQGFSRTKVTVNGDWSEQPDHVHSFLNPCLTISEKNNGARIAKNKTLSKDVRIVFVGRLDSAKGVGLALRVVAELHSAGIPVRFDLAGDGSERKKFMQMALSMNIQHRVWFHGWVSRPNLEQLYSDAHFIILPTDSEGWPKVLSEAMAYGVIPIASDVSSIGQYLQKFGTGCTVKPLSKEKLVDAFNTYIGSPEKWKRESERAVAATNMFTYHAYLKAVVDLLNLPYR